MAEFVHTRDKCTPNVRRAKARKQSFRDEKNAQLIAEAARLRISTAQLIGRRYREEVLPHILHPPALPAYTPRRRYW